jgi:hypothetical protein
MCNNTIFSRNNTGIEFGTIDSSFKRGIPSESNIVDCDFISQSDE